MVECHSRGISLTNPWISPMHHKRVIVYLNKRCNLIPKLYNPWWWKVLQNKFFGHIFTSSDWIRCQGIKPQVGSPFKDKGSNQSLISSSKTLYCLYESWIDTKFSKCIWGSLLGNPWNYLTDYNIWNIPVFSLKLFAKTSSLTILRLKSSSCGRAGYTNDMLLLSTS